MSNLPTTTARGGCDAFAWGCCIQGLHFLYVYGNQADYRKFCGQDGEGLGHTIHKGRAASLDEVRRCAEAAALELAVIYEDCGSVGAACARDQLPKRKHWPAPQGDTVVKALYGLRFAYP